MVSIAYATKNHQTAQGPKAKPRADKKQSLGQMLATGGPRPLAALSSLGGKTTEASDNSASRGDASVFSESVQRPRTSGGLDAVRVEVARALEPELVIDRPRGFKKTFHTQRGPKELTYPLDYGYFKGVINPQDNEDADVFVGSGGAHHGQFMKGKPGVAGAMVPDEHKWYSGLTPEEFKTLQDWWHNEHDAGLTWDWRTHPNREAVLASMGWSSNKTAALISRALEPDWESVPGLVRTRFKLAANMQSLVKRVLRTLTCMPGYGDVWYNAETKSLWGVLGDSDDQVVHNKWQNALQRIPGVRNVKTEAEYNPPDRENWIRIKKSNWANLPYEWAGKLTGGPSPLSNALVNTLVGGGLGYAGGAAIDTLLPDDYFRKDHWRRTLAGLGAGIGAAKPLWDAHANNQVATNAGQPLGLSALITPHTQVPVNADAMADTNNLLRGDMPKTSEVTALLKTIVNLDLVSPYFRKAANDWASGFSAGLRPVPVDAFNAAVWNDVHVPGRAANNPYGTRDAFGTNDEAMHTPPVIAAATTGLMSGLSAMYGGASLLSPRHIVNGLAAAGVDAATAKIAGGALGVLGGMTPEGQRQLQRAGLWAGFMRGITGSVLGLY